MPSKKDKLRKRIQELEKMLKEAIDVKADTESGDTSEDSSDEECGASKPKSVPAVKQTAVKAPIFRGTESEDFVAWLRNYEQVKKVNRWTTKFCLDHISTVLQEDANSKYWDCTDEERSNWGLLIEALQGKFSPESNRATFEADLESRSKKHDESLDKFMSELKALSKKAYPDWESKYRDKLVIKYFVDGLEEPLRMWVMQSNPKTPDEALQIALRSNANLKKSAPPSSGTGATVNVAQTSGTDQLAEAIALALEKRGIGNSVASHSSIEPTYQPGRGGYSGRGSRGRGRGLTARGRCHACGQQGHFWRDAACPRSPMQQVPENGYGVRKQ